MHFLPKNKKGAPANSTKAVVSKFTHISNWAIVVPVVVVLALAGGSALWFAAKQIVKPAPKKSAAQTPPKTAATQLLNAYNTTKTKVSQIPSDSQQLADLQKQMSDPKTNSDDLFQIYSDAALLAASLNKPEAKTYAQKALTLFPKDTDPRTDTRAAEQGLIDKLTAISHGDYSAAPK